MATAENDPETALAVAARDLEIAERQMEKLELQRVEVEREHLQLTLDAIRTAVEQESRLRIVGAAANGYAPVSAVTAPKPKHTGREKSPYLEDLREVVRRLLHEGTSHKDICTWLDGQWDGRRRKYPTPLATTWARLTWEQALAHEKYEGRVRKWLSDTKS